MKQRKPTGLLMLLLSIFLLLALASTVQAQTEDTGYITGAVYLDVNGDGLCFDTGVEGEGPVEGVTIEFVSSDEATVVTLTTADNGTYGLADAGESNWRVTAKPDPEKYVVTSENPIYAPVLPETGLVQTDNNFCVSKGTTTATGIITGVNAVIILPESGAPAAATTSNMLFVWVAAVFGLALIGTGIVLEIKRRSA